MSSTTKMEGVPVFLKDLANDMFTCGKSINLLKLCFPGVNLSFRFPYHVKFRPSLLYVVIHIDLLYFSITSVIIKLTFLL